jgi:tetratricopeptide (TPR) repeat protein
MICPVCRGSGISPLTDSPSRVARRVMARMISFRVTCGACKGTGYRPDPTPARPVDRSKELIERRNRIMKVLADEETSLGGLAYFAEKAAEKAASELEQLLTKWDESAGPLETGLTWRCLGDALCKAVEVQRSGPFPGWTRSQDTRLDRAFEAYGKAEPFLREASGSPELGRLYSRFGDALRLLGSGDSLYVLEKAEAHYREALRLIAASLPEEAQQIRSKLRSVDETLKTKRTLTLRPNLKTAGTASFEMLRSIEKSSTPSLPLPGSLFPG